MTNNDKRSVSEEYGLFKAYFGEKKNHHGS